MQIISSEFLVSNTNHRLCPEPRLPEFAFLGRSNVGKSSLINMLCGRRNMAKTSSAPGKTRLINHFLINEAWYLVDLPGYGYAKASKSSREQWEKMIRAYLLNRPNLMLTFILLDVRLKPQEIDIEMINWFGTNGIPIALIFTKNDKVSRNVSAANVKEFEKHLLRYWETMPSVFITSSSTSLGKESILQLIDESCKLFITP